MHCYILAFLNISLLIAKKFLLISRPFFYFRKAIGPRAGQQRENNVPGSEGKNIQTYRWTVKLIHAAILTEQEVNASIYQIQTESRLKKQICVEYTQNKCKQFFKCTTLKILRVLQSNLSKQITSDLAKRPSPGVLNTITAFINRVV